MVDLAQQVTSRALVSCRKGEEEEEKLSRWQGAGSTASAAGGHRAAAEGQVPTCRLSPAPPSQCRMQQKLARLTFGSLDPRLFLTSAFGSWLQLCQTSQSSLEKSLLRLDELLSGALSLQLVNSLFSSQRSSWPAQRAPSQWCCARCIPDATREPAALLLVTPRRPKGNVLLRAAGSPHV